MIQISLKNFFSLPLQPLSMLQLWKILMHGTLILGKATIEVRKGL